MNIFFSGIGGVGLGPLAEIALQAGHAVTGSDAVESLMTKQLRERGIEIEITMSNDYLRSVHANSPIDWLVQTSALPPNHPDLVAARELGIKVTKRDELLAYIIKEKNLKLIAVAGTHGKTTTTGMLVWAFKQAGIPVSYSIGTTVSFGPSGQLENGSEYFVYECDEFDRNFLHFSPHLSLITSLSYDHTDTYATEADYYAAFATFTEQSGHVIGWKHDLARLPDLPTNRSWQLRDDEVFALNLPGAHNRRNATLVCKGMEFLGLPADLPALERFPGTNRRFEKLADNLYSDYGHHPAEIAATLQMAREVSDHVVLVYQPHQNRRQHEIKSLYRNAFKLADRVYWLPTYLSRESPDLPILSPADLTQNLANRENVTIAEMNDELWTQLELHRESGDLVLGMGAGSIDGWLREHLQN
jgi:UDP-N-acetylmuramate--alanine ligase